MKKSRFASLSQETSLMSKRPIVSKNKSGDKFYDGFGGHSKPDTFPMGRGFAGTCNASGLAAGKKPKGVAKKPKVGVASDKNFKAINKYFNFDTP